MVVFKVTGEIKTKQRPRATVINGHARVYPPKDTIMYENYIKSEYLRQCGGYSFGKHPVKIIITCFFKLSKQLSEYGETAENLPCVTHKDLDNICKLVDGLNGIAWDDDKQIIDLKATKCYTLGEEYLCITIIDKYDEFFYKDIKDLQEKRKIDKAQARIYELLSKPKLSKAETARLEELQAEVEKYKDKERNYIENCKN